MILCRIFIIVNNKFRQIIRECFQEIIKEGEVFHSDKFSWKNSKRRDSVKKTIERWPTKIQLAVREAFKEWKQTGVLRNFHRLTVTKALRTFYKLALPQDYRLIAIEDRGDLVWVWAGTHEEFNKTLKYLQVSSSPFQRSHVSKPRIQKTPPLRESLSGVESLFNPDGTLNL